MAYPAIAADKANATTLEDDHAPHHNSLADAANLIPEWIYYLGGRLPDETSHALDDFFNSDTTADYTRKSPTSGTGSWSVSRGKLVYVGGSTLHADADVLFKSLGAVSAPVTIEVAFVINSQAVSFTQVGLIFADGAIGTSNRLSFRNYTGAVNRMAFEQGTVNSGSLLGSEYNIGEAEYGTHFFLRLIWKSANTWRFQRSVDGVSWVDFGRGDVSRTMTPTHFGLWVFLSSASYERAVDFEYLRFAEADLSA
jgi:hypothetical protein